MSTADDSDKHKRQADVAAQVASTVEELGQAVWDALRQLDKAVLRYAEAAEAMRRLDGLFTELGRRVVRPKGGVSVGDFEAFVADVRGWARCGLSYAAAMHDEGLRRVEEKSVERREARERDGVPADAPPGARIRGAVSIYVHDDRGAHLPTRQEVAAWRERLGDVLGRLERLRLLEPARPSRQNERGRHGGARGARGGQRRKDGRRFPARRKTRRTPDADRLAKIPALDTSSGTWVRNKAAATLANVTVETLRHYRCAGQVADDGMSGIDVAGRRWRREGTRYTHPWYLRESLVS